MNFVARKWLTGASAGSARAALAVIPMALVWTSLVQSARVPTTSQNAGLPMKHFVFLFRQSPSGQLSDADQNRRVATNGINLHIAEAGSGFPIILLHGVPELWYS